MKGRTFFIIFLFVLGAWFLYIERAILSPFIIAAIFAYIFNPFVNFFSKKLKLPRILSIAIIYAFILGIVGIAGAVFAKRIAEESSDITREVNNVLENAKQQANNLPDWLSPAVNDMVVTFKRSRFLNIFESPSLLPIFSQAISRVISFFIFLFSGFYFLKDGEKFIDKTVHYIPNKHKVDVEILLRKIYFVLNGYLRGEILLIAIVSASLYIVLTILGIKFALTLAVFSGIAEIVPVVGPITAGAVAIAVILLTNTANFGLTSIQAAILVAIIYFVLRQLEDYFIIPQVMEKMTKLPPFIIFFSVVAGGHFAGILGLILAVPTAAVIKLLIEFFFDKLYKS
jgi:predicted PurR-regulated permease PerM